MDENTIMEFGAVSETILCNPIFNRILAAWDETTVRLMLATKPEQLDVREQRFAQVNAVREFIGFMQDFVQQMHELQKAPDDAAQIDDPAVHDIYRTGTDY